MAESERIALFIDGSNLMNPLIFRWTHNGLI